MTQTVTATEMARHFSEYMNRVSYGGERFLVVRGKKILAEFRPAPRGCRLGDLPALIKSLPHLSSEEADAFGKDLAKARREMNRRKIQDPWA